MAQTISENLNIGSGVNPDIVLSQTSGINTVFNANKQNIDFQIYSTGNSNLTYDASTGRLGIGTGLPDAVLHVVAPCSKDGLIVESVTNCPTGVSLLLVHNPQTMPQSGSYPAIINLAGRDTNYNEIYYSQILSKILDPNTGATSGEIIFTVDHTGVNKPVFVANLQNVILGGNNRVSGSSYDIIGNYNSLTGVLLNSIGSYNSGTINSGIIIGNTNLVNGSNIFAFTNNSTFSGVSGVGIGNSILASGSNNIILGNFVNLTGLNNILLGSNNDTQISSTVGLAQSLSSFGISGIVLGSSISNTGNYNIYIGNETSISGNNNNLIGSIVYLTGNNNLSYGNQNVVVGNNLICIGSYQTASNINSGIFIGNNIGSNGAVRSMIIGIGNTNSNEQQGLSDSILLGINNTLSSGVPDKLLLVGQNNIVKDITNSLIVGNQNNASGIITNNLLIGNTNAVSSGSNNNIVLGLLNNQTGVYIDTAGNISGTPRRINSNVSNSIVAGIHNLHNDGISTNIIGNKNAVSGSSDNIIGSFNNLRNASRSYSVGNSNYMIGDNLGVMGSKTLLVGQESLAFNNANKRMDIFGSGNIALGYNQLIPSGLVVGTENKIYGLNNTIYGRNNTLGSIAHSFVMNGLTASSVTIPSLNVANKYTIGDTALLVIQSPAASNNTFIREILDIIENSLDNNTIIQFSTTVSVNASNGYYSINENFDDNNISNTIVSGLIMPHAVGGGVGGPETNPTYGSNNIIIGSNNRYIYSSGTIIGFNNTISGVRNVAVGYNMSGVADNTVYIGTNNNNKIILDNERVVFNSGRVQEQFVVKSSDDNTSVLNIDLNNNRVGVNTNNPTADLSISGLISTDTIRVGFSSPDQYVLTSNVNGFGTWQLPVRLSGLDNGLMCRINEKVGSGISNIYFNPAGNSLNFDLDSNNGFVLNPTGIFINDNGNIYNMRIRGSGGTDFARVLFNTNFGNHRIDFFNTSGNSGILNSLNVISGVSFPTNLTGTFLYVNNSGRLLSYPSRPYSVLYANENSWATGDTSFRWFNNQSTLGLGATGVISYDILSTNSNDTRYNILLSSNNQIDTTFNNLGLGNKFSIINSGALNTRRGLYVNPVSGQVAINVIPDTYNSVTNQAHLYVEGRTWTNSLRIGPGTTTSGLYLRVDNAGNVVPSTLDLTTQFSGNYPINTTYTSLGQNNAFRVDIGLQNVDRAGNSLAVNNDGQFLIWDGAKWDINKGLTVPQSSRFSNDNRTLRGIQFGHKVRLNTTHHSHVFGAGSFFNGSAVPSAYYDGSSQFAQYYLRARTPTGGSYITALTTDFAKDSATTENQHNTISLGQELALGSIDSTYDTVWTYNIFVSVLWQDGVSSSIPANGNRQAAGMTIEGCVYRSSNGSVFTKLGQERINIYSTGLGVLGLPAGMGVATHLDNDAQTNVPRLSIRATGVDGKTALWSATAQINQLNHPGPQLYNLYGNT
jgi:hypothetical protein